MVRNLDFNSSVLDRGTFDSETGSLSLVFKTGTEYVYEGVTEREVDDLLNAPSQGRFFRDVIRAAKANKRVS